MENFYRKLDYFSSDWNCGSLVYSDKRGELVFVSKGNFDDPRLVCSAEEDKVPKNAKFYPFDDLVITTTDGEGLRIWDGYHSDLAYAYPEEPLRSHTYSEDGILASFDEYNIKIYDLRMRYRAQNIKSDKLVSLAWTGNFLYGFTGESVKTYDARALRPIRCLENIQDFKSYRSGVFMCTKHGLLYINGEYSKTISFENSDQASGGNPRADGSDPKTNYDDSSLIATNCEGTAILLASNANKIFTFDKNNGSVSTGDVSISNKDGVMNAYFESERVIAFASDSLKIFTNQEFYCPLSNP